MRKSPSLILRDHADQRVADLEDDSVIADVEALLLQALDEREDELLVFVGVADEGRGHARSLRRLPQAEVTDENGGASPTRSHRACGVPS